MPGHPVHTHIHNIHNTNCTLVVIYARCGYLACFSCYRCVFHQLSLSFLYGEYHSFCLLSLPFNTFKGPLVASVYCIGGVFPPYICIYIHDLYCTCGVVVCSNKAWCALSTFTDVVGVHCGSFFHSPSLYSCLCTVFFTMCFSKCVYIYNFTLTHLALFHNTWQCH